MAATQYYCANPLRRQKLRGQSQLNGIDYLEVASPDEKTLAVHFFHNLPGQPNPVPPAGAPLGAQQIAIEGGVRVANIRVLSVAASNEVLTITVDAAGDYSSYTLRLVTSATDPNPPAGFDSQFSAIDFSFKAACPSDFDCKMTKACPPVTAAEPAINYLAKDYATFRRLMLDRLSATIPAWTERNAADLGIALVETLAYAADYLSYYQDAVATEAYLGTARRRVSVRRHARLLDYRLHDGVNARTWVYLNVTPGSSAEGATLPAGTLLLTRIAGAGPELKPADVDAAVSAGAQAFETMHDIVLRAEHNDLHFYTWGDAQCCLPRGATHATLKNHLANLKAGDVLVFEEARDPANGVEQGDPAHRHAVRLTKVAPTSDPLFGNEPVTDIDWDPADALPFPLCISVRIDLNDIADISLAHGNIVLADHGQTLTSEALPPVPAVGAYRPQLKYGPVTQQGRMLSADGDWVSVDPAAPAASAFALDPRRALPAVEVSGEGQTWTPQLDLLESSRFAPDFVVETENDGSATLRFGDNVLGREPGAGQAMTAQSYRVGNGSAGNVGREAIAHVVPMQHGATPAPHGIAVVRNPMPAQGGADPESLDEARLYAPQAFRVQQRAVTMDDYAAVAGRHPQISRAVATLRWTGSWHTVFVTVDRKGSETIDDAFKRDVRNFIEQFRLAGYDLEVEAPQFVPLDLGMTVCAASGYFAADVELALLRIFSDADLPDGTRGFFHPDNFTFGQPVYLSQIVAAAMGVPGVDWVRVDRFQRFGELPQGELAAGQIRMQRLEIARLDNDPNRPENGRIEFTMQGGT